METPKWAVFSRKKQNLFVHTVHTSLDAKVQNSTFRNISNVGLCRLNINLRKKFLQFKVFWNTKICRKYKSQWVWGKLETTKIVFSMTCYTADFSQFFSTTVKICLFGGRRVAAGYSPSIPGISEILLKFPDLLKVH